jgi:hypothetical protein
MLHIWAADNRQSLQVYLDQLHWVSLARAATDRPAGHDFKRILRAVGNAVDSGKASFPLSSHHYYENHKQHDIGRRHHMASVMAGISQYATIGSLEQVIPGELEKALQARFGRPQLARPVLPFGTGVEHAFGQPRSVLPIPDGLDAALAQGIYSAIQFAMLGGDTTRLGIPPSQLPSAFTLFDESFRSSRQRLNDLALGGRIARRDVVREVAAGALHDIIHPLGEALQYAGVSWEEFEALGESGWIEFLHDLPSRDVDLELLQLRHRNPQKAWDANDLTDVSALAIAVPYCDVVVTERLWSDLIKRSKLDKKYNTVVFADLNDLIGLLESDTVTSTGGDEEQQPAPVI